ncbi:YncE family protein [Streptosporangium fragile]|uniref:YncE family protein n=1 Tax=Streptosporangium fragile TaxID=46186 RepID=A0ABP6IHI4_9ACTN
MRASPVKSVILLSVAALAAALVGPAAAPQASAADRRTSAREVLLVGNAKGGTVSFLDAATYRNLGSLNAVPDLAERLRAMNPVERAGYETVNRIQGYRKLVDDMALSPDGRTLYVSRGNLSDAVAFDVASGRMLWRYKIEGFKADHAALSPDGTRFIVSATTASAAQVLDTATGRLVTNIPTGTYPHANDYSPDGRFLYNSSIGITSLPRALNALKGARQLTIVDGATLKVLKKYTFEYGIRPAVFTPDNRTMYTQFSYLNGLAEVDLTTGKVTRRVELPFSEAGRRLPVDDYPQNSAHHGMAMSGDGGGLCVAGTIDDYVAIVDRPGLTARGYVHYDTGSLPYWTTTSADGRRCFVSLSERNEISVVDYGTAREVARVPVGDFPQRERLGRVPEDVIASLDPAGG